MWILKLKLRPEGFLLGSFAVKFKVDMIGYPLSYYKDRKNLFLTSAGFVIGDDANKKRLIEYAKKNKDVVNIEINGDFIINVTKQSLYSEPIYDPRLIRPAPFFLSREGYHIWEVASWNKEPLMKIVAFATKHHKGEILKFVQEKLSNISFTSLFPELSDRQKQALDLAVSEGYYDYPRKMDLHRLAKIMKVSYSTFQEHLRKAEAKFIPILSRRV